MLKSAIAPIQAWLMSQGRCVACGKAIKDGKHAKYIEGTEKITCSCGRVFVYNPKTKTYRRALISEV